MLYLGLWINKLSYSYRVKPEWSPSDQLNVIFFKPHLLKAYPASNGNCHTFLGVVISRYRCIKRVSGKRFGNNLRLLSFSIWQICSQEELEVHFIATGTIPINWFILSVSIHALNNLFFVKLNSFLWKLKLHGLVSLFTIRQCYFIIHIQRVLKSFLSFSVREAQRIPSFFFIVKQFTCCPLLLFCYHWIADA